MNGIDGVVPINEAHQKRLERLKTNLERLHARYAKEAAMVKIETEMTKERVANTRELSQLRVVVGAEIRDALYESLGEQTALILRIAKKVRPE